MEDLVYFTQNSVVDFSPSFYSALMIAPDNISFGDIIIPSATLTHLRSLFKSYMFYRCNLSHI